ncbi:MAG: tetratricopeptide repeat protein [Gemmatimonadetes bacterium]|nr:tetratricopeptide repeat protein [Gemmatimonadota bacterium]
MKARRLALWGLLLIGAGPLAAQTRDAALEAWQTGKYDEAISAYEGLARRPGAPADAHRDLARVLLEVGRTDDAERHIRAAGAGPHLANVLGEIMLASGKWTEAEAAFRTAAAVGASDAMVARANLGELLWSRGRHAEALRIFDGFIDLYNRGGARGAAELIAVGRAVRRLGATNPQIFQDALLAFDQAAQAAPGDPLPRVLAGELFLEKYNGTEAHDSFKQALARNPNYPPALLGEARALDFDGATGGWVLTAKALETNPRSVAAHALRAAMALGAEDFSRSIEEAETALTLNAASRDALAVLAAARFLSGDQKGFETARERALAINPADADFFQTVAEMSVQHRRYADAVAMAARGVALDSLAWGTRGLLGMNQLRVGAITEGRANVERAFAGDPYNVWFKNTLDLLDTFTRYRAVRTPHFELFLRQDEADLLEPYVRSLAEEAYTALAGRYGAEPQIPIRLELFPRHADFSVRALGLSGLGALGVAFGPVLVMDSPSAHEPGEFNWGSTLWHELSHAFHLGMTGNRVPRWFTEGLAVHEQRAGRPGWGFPVSLSFLQAYRDEKLPKPSELNQGFMRPAYPEQVIHSYFMASLVFAWMEETHGKDAALRMLRGYGEGKDTPSLIRDVLGMGLSEFDRDVDHYIRTRYADAFRSTAPIDGAPTMDAPLTALQAAARQHPGSFPIRLRLGQLLMEAGQPDDAEVELKEALELFPTYAEVDGPYLYLARIHRGRGELDKAANALVQLGNLNESAYEVHLIEADVRKEMGDLEGAAQALERAILVNPYEIGLHQKLAEIETGLARHEDAVRERRAVVALNPVDRADAHYRLARALLEAGRRDDARREVLRALEAAPNYEHAQDLLLELRGSGR